MADEDSFGLYSDPLNSMFSPTSYTSGSNSLLGNRKMSATHAITGKGAMTMPPPDARRSHGALIGSKQGTHARTASAHGVQSVRVEISPTGSPNSPIPPSVTSNIKAPTINAFRRCLMIRGGGGGSGHSRHTPSPPPQPYTESNSLFLCNGQSAQFQGDSHFSQVEVTFTDNSVEVAVGGGHESYSMNEGEGDTEVEETHIFLFDNDPNEDISLTVSSSRGHAGGKERPTKKALACKASAPYVKTSTAIQRDNQSNSAAALAVASRRQRRACRSRYDIEDEDNDGDSGAAIYYVQVGHSALTPRDCPDDVVAVPQMPLLPSSIATAVIDKELAVLEELML